MGGTATRQVPAAWITTSQGLQLFHSKSIKIMNLYELLDSLTNKELHSVASEFAAINCMTDPANVRPRSEALEALFSLADRSFLESWLGKWQNLGQAITSQVMRRFLDGVVA